jgi:hypothetical protein
VCARLFLSGCRGLKEPGLSDLVVCGGSRVEDRAAGISDTAKKLAERLGDENFLREIAARLPTVLTR